MGTVLKFNTDLCYTSTHWRERRIGSAKLRRDPPGTRPFYASHWLITRYGRPSGFDGISLGEYCYFILAAIIGLNIYRCSLRLP